MAGLSTHCCCKVGGGVDPLVVFSDGVGNTGGGPVEFIDGA